MASKTDKLFKGMSTKKIANVASMGGEVLDLPNYSGVGHNKTTKNLFDERYGQLSEDNTWTEDNTFEGEVKGTKESIMMGYNRGLSCAAGVEKFLQIADTIKMTDNKGICMIRDGSIVGMSINFDITGATGKISTLLLRVKKNGTAVWEEAVSNTIQSTDKTDYKTQARGVDKFSAGDTISVCVVADGVSGTLTLAKVLVQLQYYYDD